MYCVLFVIICLAFIYSHIKLTLEEKTNIYFFGAKMVFFLYGACSISLLLFSMEPTPNIEYFSDIFPVEFLLDDNIFLDEPPKKKPCRPADNPYQVMSLEKKNIILNTQKASDSYYQKLQKQFEVGTMPKYLHIREILFVNACKNKFALLFKYFDIDTANQQPLFCLLCQTADAANTFTAAMHGGPRNKIYLSKEERTVYFPAMDRIFSTQSNNHKHAVIQNDIITIWKLAREKLKGTFDLAPHMQSLLINDMFTVIQLLDTLNSENHQELCQQYSRTLVERVQTSFLRWTLLTNDNLPPYNAALQKEYLQKTGRYNQLTQDIIDDALAREVSGIDVQIDEFFFKNIMIRNAVSTQALPHDQHFSAFYQGIMKMSRNIDNYKHLWSLYNDILEKSDPSNPIVHSYKILYDLETLENIHQSVDFTGDSYQQAWYRAITQSGCDFKQKALGALQLFVKIPAPETTHSELKKKVRNDIMFPLYNHSLDWYNKKANNVLTLCWMSYKLFAASKTAWQHLLFCDDINSEAFLNTHKNEILSSAQAFDTYMVHLDQLTRSSYR